MSTFVNTSKGKKAPLFFLLLLSMIFFSSTLNFDEVVVGYSIYHFKINMVLKTNGGGIRPDVCSYIANQLEAINIDVELKVEEWVVFLGTLLLNQDFDLAYVGLTGGATPDLRDIYTEEGSLNIFGISQDIPYCNQSEVMQNQGVQITDLEERQQHYYNWQQLLMDKIVPMLPFYSPRIYVATWANTLGYDARWGLSDSLPYMSYSGYHDGQTSLNEFNIASYNWKDLNPLISNSDSDTLIQGLLSENIVQFSPYYAPIKTGLVHDWEQIDEFHYKFYMRDNIYWNPSYDTRERTASSAPLITSGELLTGLKAGQYSDGTNQQVTAKDAVFTYLLWSNPEVSEDTSYHSWISNIYVDPIDDLAFHIHIDGDPYTPENEPYVDLWTRLPWEVLPEFFLNSSSSTITYSSGGVECKGIYSGMELTSEWLAYSESAFGCGKYMLDYSISNSITVLERSPYWFGVGPIDGSTGLEPFVNNINIRVIPDSSAELAEFRAGKLDFVRLTEFKTERKQMQADPRYNVQTYLTGAMTFLAFNMRRNFLGGPANHIFLTEPGLEEYTAGIALRKAICYAIDRETINQALFDGEETICHSPIYPIMSFYLYNDIIKYNYDLEAAKEWFNRAVLIPVLELTVENHNEIGKDIIFQADYTSGPEVTSSVLDYFVDDYYPIDETVLMMEDKYNYYTYNIGSDYINGTQIVFSITATNIYGHKFSTGTILFNVGTRNEALYASFPVESIFCILIIPVIFSRIRRKKEE
ncbi:MAG: hypothetical protein GOP50_04590 [Candidatus Heimdallarchaeota archaeon]|nr:hypothetical protein [Candidatus Heimdallarchaeota archaeon]